MDAKNEKKLQFKSVDLFEIEGFLKDVAECPLKPGNIKDLQPGTIVMCHQFKNWTDPEVLGTVHYVSETPVKLGKDHRDMAESQLFVKPGNMAKRNTKYNTLNNMISMFVCLRIWLSSHHHFLLYYREFRMVER